ncbi:nucleotide-binding universal stress UspA family protein [Labrenzia sp. EL_208]|uniref:Universal stress protein G n=1 Tax=Roseibium album TaxID=311410 RepID=A0A0M6ZCL2_9HYPH|nr:universal stress protein [Roseibium album]MBG6148355.1 nucleotide-binding universal stress UspA family protein [Labrenzia sp. EL_142]MBG6156658.1 nucleotide-binding universal stress UspA family protein [Labrenzia sp. EL_162]MBG6173319.1 nucleotide-binding universal stress UspA family protein [Labrenzia sp. EL_132]MBG6195402.1 nucleotide-binding universal stress UspA family protein [Labrenzia sp. EL_159]MBG6202413.1 nucleotide-binding universal stress UspA family protein [Labrenzia sp. EL_13
MYKQILIPVALDHETLIARKLDIARHLLAEDGQITLLTVLESIPGFVSEFVDLKIDNHLTQKVAEKLRAAVGEDQHIACEVVTGKPGVQIAAYAEANDTDLILVGSHHPSAQDYFLGSTASRVVRRAGCSVFVVRDGDS